MTAPASDRSAEVGQWPAPSPRAFTIVCGLARGQDRDQIAATLHISRWTVNETLRRTFLKLEVRSSPALVHYCYDKGFLHGLTPEERAPVYLSRRQEQVLFLVAKGKSSTEVAELLALTSFTIRTHLHHIRQLYGAKTTTHAVALYWQQRLKGVRPKRITVTCANCPRQFEMESRVPRHEGVRAAGWYSTSVQHRCPQCQGALLYRKGAPWDEVADVLSIPASSVEEFMRERGVTRSWRKTTAPEIRQVICDGVQAKASYGKIAESIHEEFGVTVSRQSVERTWKKIRGRDAERPAT